MQSILSGRGITGQVGEKAKNKSMYYISQRIIITTTTIEINRQCKCNKQVFC